MPAFDSRLPTGELVTGEGEVERPSVLSFRNTGEEGDGERLFSKPMMGMSRVLVGIGDVMFWRCSVTHGHNKICDGHTEARVQLHSLPFWPFFGARDDPRLSIFRLPGILTELLTHSRCTRTDVLCSGRRLCLLPRHLHRLQSAIHSARVQTSMTNSDLFQQEHTNIRTHWRSKMAQIHFITLRLLRLSSSPLQASPLRLVSPPA